MPKKETIEDCVKGLKISDDIYLGDNISFLGYNGTITEIEPLMNIVKGKRRSWYRRKPNLDYRLRATDAVIDILKRSKKQTELSDEIKEIESKFKSYLEKALNNPQKYFRIKNYNTHTSSYNWFRRKLEEAYRRLNQDGI